MYFYSNEQSEWWIYKNYNKFYKEVIIITKQEKLLLIILLLTEINENPNFQTFPKIFKIKKILEELEKSNLLKKFEYDFNKYYIQRKEGNTINNGYFNAYITALLYESKQSYPLYLDNYSRTFQESCYELLDNTAKFFDDYFEVSPKKTWQN